MKKTEYLGYDPFGRPATIRPPDGPSHDVTLAYTGVRLTSRTETVATSTGVESPSTRTEERDVHGRLVKVTEPSGSNGTNVSTTYAFDVGGRLRQASTTSGFVTQNRTFTFDNRGFLLTEQLPEVGASGNGNVTYSKYDARGHARRIHDGAHDLAYSYDAGERLTQVAQANVLGNPGSPVVRTFSYATANGTGDYRNGKLQTATANNPELTSASVVETYSYGGVGGRVSARRTVVEGRTIDQTFTWSDLGQVSTLGYPDDTGLAGVFDPARSVAHGYSLGALTSVAPYLPSITYHPNGTVSEVLRSNGMKDVHLKDPNDMARARQIYVQRVSDGNVYGGWGPWDYDGAGNVKTQGSDVFWYDLVSRLTFGTTTSGTNLQCATYNAFGTMTGLGTGTTGCTASPIAVNAATNRLSSPVTYDSAGNVTAWGGNTYSWNRQNQMYSTTGSGINRNYLYSADGERVAERNNQDGTRTIRIRDLSGKVLREYGRTSLGVWSWSKDYVYRDGVLAATETSSETRHYHHDHLGSVRGATDMQSPPGIYWDTVRDYYPFGLDAFSKPDPERMRFTGHERDTQGTLSQTDDLDYMHARHYSPVVGRFLSIDPGRDWNASDPQSWNLYAYARNNPLKYVDPDGKAVRVFDYYTGSDFYDSVTRDRMALILRRAGVEYVRVNDRASSFGVADLRSVLLNSPNDDIILLSHGRMAGGTADFLLGRDGEPMFESGLGEEFNVRSLSLIGCFSASICSSALDSTPGVSVFDLVDTTRLGYLAAYLGALGAASGGVDQSAAAEATRRANTTPFVSRSVPPVRPIYRPGRREEDDPFSGTGFVSADNVRH